MDQKTFSEHCTQLFKDQFGQPAQVLSIAPGRINIIGDHTDYNGGLSMPAAINRWNGIAAAPSDDGEWHIVGQDIGEVITFQQAEIPDPVNDFQKYMLGGLKIFTEEFENPGPLKVLVTGNIPRGAGLSSSAALEVAWFNLLANRAGQALDGKQLCRMGQRIEHEFLGLKSGLLDQYSSFFSKAGQLMAIDFREDAIEWFPVEMKDWTWVTVNSMVRRNLSNAKYTERVEETAEGLKILGLEHFRDITIDAIWSYLEDPNLAWPRRLRHYLSENRRVGLAKTQLRNGKFWELGLTLSASHYNLKQNYRVSCPELDFLQEAALTFHACAGARMMGGGFGGCTLNLVRSSEVLVFKEFISQAFFNQYGVKPDINQFELVGGAEVLSLNDKVSM